MKKSTIAGIIGAGLVLAVVGPFVTYYLPSTVVVQLSGTEVKRSELGQDDAVVQPIRDVRYVLAQDPKTHETMVFRNEDTRWSWPPYFKFNSSDLSGKAMDIARSKPDATVAVTYYGTRSSVLDVYPNLVALEVVPADYVHIPVFNIVFVLAIVTMLVLGVVFARRGGRRVSAWWAAKRAAKA